MSAATTLLGHALRPRVVHRLPGRVRVNLPLLRRVPRGGASIAAQVRPLVLLLPGVESVDVSFASGNALIRFDARRVNEARIVEWVTQLGRLVMEHRERLAATPPARVPALVERFETILAPIARDPRRAAADLEIPADVWR